MLHNKSADFPRTRHKGQCQHLRFCLLPALFRCGRCSIIKVQGVFLIVILSLLLIKSKKNLSLLLIFVNLHKLTSLFLCKLSPCIFPRSWSFPAASRVARFKRSQCDFSIMVVSLYSWTARRRDGLVNASCRVRSFCARSGRVYFSEFRAFPAGPAVFFLDSWKPADGPAVPVQILRRFSGGSVRLSRFSGDGRLAFSAGYVQTVTAAACPALSETSGSLDKPFSVSPDTSGTSAAGKGDQGMN